MDGMMWMPRLGKRCIGVNYLKTSESSESHRAHLFTHFAVHICSMLQRGGICKERAQVITHERYALGAGLALQRAEIRKGRVDGIEEGVWGREEPVGDESQGQLSREG